MIKKGKYFYGVPDACLGKVVVEDCEVRPHCVNYDLEDLGRVHCPHYVSRRHNGIGNKIYSYLNVKCSCPNSVAFIKSEE